MAAKVGNGSKGKYRLGQNADINVTPFVDVMLVLLIIFMVAAPMATLATKIDLPPLRNGPPPKNPTYISVTRQGLYVTGTPTTLPQLGGELARHFNLARPQGETVMVRADRDVKYADFMAVVNQLQTDGYYRIGLIAEDPGTV